MSDYRRRRSSSGGNNRRFTPRKKVCQFCAENATHVDYKNVDLLRRYISDVGKIRPRRQTGTCAKHQRVLASAVKRARQIALLPFVAEIPDN